MQNQSSEVSVTTLKERIFWFRKAILSEIKLAFKIDKNSAYPILPRFFLVTSIKGASHTVKSSFKILKVLRVINIAYKLVDASNQRTKKCQEFLPFFGIVDNEGRVKIVLPGEPGISIVGNSVDDVIAELQDILNKGKLNSKEITREDKKLIKQAIAGLSFRKEHSEFVSKIDHAKDVEVKSILLRDFLEEQIATRKIEIEKENKLAKVLRKEQEKQKVYLIMSIMSLLKYAIKPFLWIMSFILGASALAFLTTALAICAIAIVLVKSAVKWHRLYGDIIVAARNGLSKKEWRELTLKQKFFMSFRCFFTEGLYGNAASNIARLSTSIVLGVLSLSFIGLASPTIIVVFSVIALLGKIIALIGKLHKEINAKAKGGHDFTTVAKEAMTEILKILLCGGILVGLSFVALASTPIVNVIICIVLFGGLASVGYKWYKDSTAQQMLLEGTSPVQLPQKDETASDMITVSGYGYYGGCGSSMPYELTA